MSFNAINAIKLPLLHLAAEAIAWRQGQAVTRSTFLGHLNAVVQHLPRHRYAINLCEDRYLFMVAFAAAVIQDQTNLLPSSRVKEEIRHVTDAYPDSYRISDADIRTWLAAGAEPFHGAVAEIPADHIAAITFTSGSTGRAQPNPKPWGSLVTGGGLAERRFGFGSAAIVATVPPQHQYGLETSIMVPLTGGASVHGGRPFFPADIRQALAEVPAPRVLVTTPVHLRVCVKSAMRWPPLDFIVSATAPLATALAAEAEQAFAAPVFEIYGFTEAGSIASRRTLEGDVWRLYDGLRINQEDCVYGGHLPQPIRLNDIVELQTEVTFKLLGREQDMVNIAGKRTSLSYLNHKLNEIQGVEDGIFIMPEDRGAGITRLQALVVAPQLSEKQVLSALAERIDPVFLPRPLLKVERLPRNETGKLPRSALLTLLETLTGRGDARRPGP